MILALATFLLLDCQQVVQPRVVSDEEIRGAGFADDWRFPRELPNGKATPGVEFENAMIKLVQKPLLPATAGQPEVWLGDLVREMQAGQWSKKTSERLLKPLKKKLPSRDYYRVKDLLQAYDLYGRKWNPRKGGQAHGMRFGPSWEFGKNDWAEVGGDREVEQIAQLVVADIQALKVAEANYRGYWDHVKHDWEEISVVDDSFMQCRNEEGKIVHASVELDFEFDLPFPFSTAEFHLYTLNTLLPDGRPILYLRGHHSDFYWLAGYDIYHPVYDRNGDWVATLMVRQFGMDLDGVPDGTGDRHDNLRGQYGNLRRDAERVFIRRNRDKDQPEVYPYTGSLPPYEVVLPGKPD